MRAARLTLVPCAALAVGWTALGVHLHDTRGTLGTATPPFVMAQGWAAEPGWLALAVVVLVAVVALGARTPARSGAPGALAHPAAQAVALTAASLASALAVNAVRHGPLGWTRIFDGSFEAPNEYLPGLPAVSYGARVFLDRFAETVPALPVNVAGHPPGLLLVLYATGIATPATLAALCIGCAALVPLGAVLTARAVGLPAAEARVAGLACALSPTLLLFGTTSADAVFAAAGTATAAALVSRRPAVAALGAVGLALSALLSWALLAVGAWAVLIRLQRDGLRAAAALAVACGVAVIGLQGVLAAATGYDPIGTLRATEAYYRLGVSSARPWWFWSIGSPVAFGVMLGLPLSAALIVAVARRRPEALALAAVIAVAALGGFTKAEVERIWLPFVPLACVAGAPLLLRLPLRPLLAALALQALLTTVAFDTIW